MSFCVEKQCDYCGKTFEVRHRKRLEAQHLFCSRECESAWRRSQLKEPIVTCPVCGKQFHVKPRDLRKAKHEPCCSRACLGIYRSRIYQGENNPNYGNRGSRNPIWKSDRKISNYGYAMVRVPDHPFCDCDGFVREHRLVAEQYLLTPETTVWVDGKPYLSPDYIVHHKDHNRLNNDPDNLEVMTLADHMRFHHQERKELASQNSEKSVKPTDE